MQKLNLIIYLVFLLIWKIFVKIQIVFSQAHEKLFLRLRCLYAVANKGIIILVKILEQNSLLVMPIL